MIRYMCHAGYVISPVDGDLHYVGSETVSTLYGVPRDECIMVRDIRALYAFTNKYIESLVHLFPRNDGNYSKIPLPGVVENAK